MQSGYYLKSFFIGFAPVFLVYFTMNYEKDFISLKAAIMGAAAGAVFLFLAMISAEIKKKSGAGEGDMFKVKYQKDLDLDGTTEEIAGYIKNMAEELRWKTREEKPGFISMRTSINLKTFGTILSFEITQNPGNRSVHVKINSSPLVPTTIIDFGDSLEKIKTAEDRLLKLRQSGETK